jgi:hypothetical protein
VRIWGDALSSGLLEGVTDSPFEIEVWGSHLRVKGRGWLTLYTALGQEIAQKAFSGEWEIRLRPGVYYVRFADEAGRLQGKRLLITAEE